METRFLLRPVPPFRLDLTAWALQRRPGNLIDRWDGRTYHRVLAVEEGTFDVAVCEADESGRTLKVTVKTASLQKQTKQRIKELLECVLGVRSDLSGFYRMGEKDPMLKPLVRRFRGLKPPRFFSTYEGLINGISCQQLSLALGIQLLGRLTRRFGPSLGNGDSASYGFPRPQDLAVGKPEDVKSLGYNFQKARTMVDISRAIVEGRLDLGALARESDEEAIRQLMKLPGVGRWTAEYTLLRGMGRWHIFPGDDQGARNSLACWLHLRKPLNAIRARRIIGQWQPYGGLIYFHMLMKSLSDAGYLRSMRSREK